MNHFENQLDEIRIALYEETKEMAKEDIINNVNARARIVAQEFEIKIEKLIEDRYVQPVIV